MDRIWIKWIKELQLAKKEMLKADIVIIIGSSMQVYPAAGLVGYAPPDATVYYIDPKPQINYEMRMRPGLEIIEKSAVEGVPELVGRINRMQL